ncbi:hypothetical protein [Enterococcus plantarum]|uniref:hypothetical protein n=1 Tax=Enterococcus plantarum TaxID=1077675 RepID=UPI001F5F1348|nr:hypothetical protein [Enterococcus plantarum]
MNSWIGVASKNNVEIGVAGGFCQLCHGKSAPLGRFYLEKLIHSKWLLVLFQLEEILI